MASASVFAEAIQRQVRFRYTPYDGGEQPNILMRLLNGNNNHPDNESWLYCQCRIHLTAAPDLLIFDGQGIAHPRRCGLASHLGLLLDIPSIGCAKTRLSGWYEAPRREKGSYSYLKDGEETIGAVVRTRSKVKPLFVSIGHRINLHDSINIVLKCCSKYRLPETTRRADKLARSRLMG